ncbi:beta-D-glucosyl crocetin beta-1,6-glucosyltransferase-like [Momordica charantia]|uniref:Beta-D-glucosyl crocetin beta-1,6-glucosyltransferase-like n=1 Tax=Momordica charantia TaxID=3673 RepID=A0A6J1D9L8_MOMCH|nr:beta-D-glucosyl crocetin beta-1,6-glucosyltransferase-like [Momordica charantia]
MDAREESFKIFMLPWLAHGHISPFIELAKRLVERKFLVYFCSTPVNLEAIKPNLPQTYSASIHLLEIHLDSTPELPPHHHTTKGLLPHLMPKLEDAFKMASPNLESVLKTLNPDLLVADILLPWILPLSASLNIPMIFFSIFGATAISFMCNRTASDELRFPELELHECWKSKCPYLYKDHAEGQSFLKYLDLDEAGKIRRGEVAAGIKKVVVEETGEAFRKRAEEISGVLKVTDEEEIDALAMELARLCHVNKGRA